MNNDQRDEIEIARNVRLGMTVDVLRCVLPSDGLAPNGVVPAGLAGDRRLVTRVEVLEQRWPTSLFGDNRPKAWDVATWLYIPVWDAHVPRHTNPRCVRCAAARQNEIDVQSRPPLELRDAWGTVGLVVYDEETAAPFGDPPIPHSERKIFVPWVTPLTVVDTEAKTPIPGALGPYAHAAVLPWGSAPVGHPREGERSLAAMHGRVAPHARVPDDVALGVVRAVKAYAHAQSRVVLWRSYRVTLLHHGTWCQDHIVGDTGVMAAEGFTHIG